MVLVIQRNIFLSPDFIVDTVSLINSEQFYRLLTIYIWQFIVELSTLSYYYHFISKYVGFQLIATHGCQRNVQTEKGVITEKIKDMLTGATSRKQQVQHCRCGRCSIWAGGVFALHQHLRCISARQVNSAALRSLLIALTPRRTRLKDYIPVKLLLLLFCCCCCCCFCCCCCCYRRRRL